MTPYNLKNLIDSHTDLISKSLLIRRVEEKILSLFSEGKINGTVHTCIGQEFVGPCLEKNLKEGDFILSNHRGHGHFLARTEDLKGLFSEIMGRETGVCKGVGGSQHLFAKNYISNGIQGSTSPVAAGIALANKINKKDEIVISFIGDGTLGQGVLYEAFNICGLWNLPVLFVLENNGYAQSTNIKQSFSGETKKRAQGFGLDYLKANTWDIDDLVDKASKSVDLVRNNQAPLLLEIETFRLMSHSKGDDNRDENEVLTFLKKDLLTKIIESKSKKVSALLSQIDKDIDEAITFSLNSPTLKANSPSASYKEETKFEAYNLPESNKRINELIYEGFRDIFETDKKMIMIGEDIEYQTKYTPKPYGGAFKVTKDLSKLFEDRVKNTPISEAAITGVGTGLALAGMKPMVEIMFGDFITLAFDQIIQASKFCSMFGTNVDVPLIIRTPMGGRRGYGPTHSQSLEKHFLGIPNLSIVALNQRVSPIDLYKAIHKENKNPTLVIENKVLYTKKINNKEILGFGVQHSNEKFPTLRIFPLEEIQPDITIVCYGGMLEEVEKAIELAFEEDEIFCEIICPTLISPLNIEPVIRSIKVTKNLLTVEEGNHFASLGSEILARVIESGARIEKFKKIGFNDIIPCSFEAENNLLPNSKNIFTQIKEMRYKD